MKPSTPTVEQLKTRLEDFRVRASAVSPPSSLGNYYVNGINETGDENDENDDDVETMDLETAERELRKTMRKVAVLQSKMTARKKKKKKKKKKKGDGDLLMSPVVKTLLNAEGGERRVPLRVSDEIEDPRVVVGANNWRNAATNTNTNNLKEEGNTVGGKVGKDLIDEFLFYARERRQNAAVDERVTSAVEFARSKIFLEVMNYTSGGEGVRFLPGDADEVSVAICERFAALATRNAKLSKLTSEARETIERLSLELNSFRDNVSY